MAKNWSLFVEGREIAQFSYRRDASDFFDVTNARIGRVELRNAKGETIRSKGKAGTE